MLRLAAAGRAVGKSIAFGSNRAKRLRAFFALRNNPVHRTQDIRTGVKVLRSNKALEDDRILNHVRAISKSDVNSWILHNPRFSIPGRRLAVAKDIRLMRKKYGSQGARNTLISAARNYKHSPKRQLNRLVNQEYV